MAWLGSSRKQGCLFLDAINPGKGYGTTLGTLVNCVRVR
jgi:hypothetical protein